MGCKLRCVLFHIHFLRLKSNSQRQFVSAVVVVWHNWAKGNFTAACLTVAVAIMQEAYELGWFFREYLRRSLASVVGMYENGGWDAVTRCSKQSISSPTKVQPHVFSDVSDVGMVLLHTGVGLWTQEYTCVNFYALNLEWLHWSQLRFLGWNWMQQELRENYRRSLVGLSAERCFGQIRLLFCIISVTPPHDSAYLLLIVSPQSISFHHRTNGDM